MEKKTTHRIIGVLVVIALVVILMPLLFGGNHSEVSQTASVKAPPFPDQEATTPTRVGQPDNLANANNAEGSSQNPASPEIQPSAEGQTLGALNTPQQNAADQDSLHPQTLAQDAGGSLSPADLGPNPQSTPPPTENMAANQSSGAPVSAGQPISSGQPVSTGQPASAGQPLSTGQPISSGPPISSGQPTGSFNNPVSPPAPTSIQTNQFNQPLNQNQPSDSMQPSQAAQTAGQGMSAQPMQNPVPGSTTPPASSTPSPMATPNQSMSNPGQPLGAPSISSSDSANSAVSQTVSINADGNVIATDDKPIVHTKKIAMNQSTKKHSPHAHGTNSNEPSQALKHTAWVVQMGSFHNKENAQRLADNLRAKGFKAFTREIKSSTRVYVGPEFKQATAESLINKLQSAVNIQGIVITYHPLEL